MNLFQWLTVPPLVIAALAALLAFLRDHRFVRLLQGLLGLTAAALILSPQTATDIAGTLGIGRGADLVFYSFMLVVTIAMLHLHGRLFTLQRQLVELTRREALREPQSGYRRQSPEMCSLPETAQERQS